MDVHIQVSPKISVSEGHYIGDQVHLKLQETVPNIIDVTVHVDPENDEMASPSRHLPNRQTIDQLLKTHCSHLPGFREISHYNLHYLRGQLYIEIYMPATMQSITSSTTLKKQYESAIHNASKYTNIIIYFELK